MNNERTPELHGAALFLFLFRHARTRTRTAYVGDEVTPMYDVHGICGVTRAM